MKATPTVSRSEGKKKAMTEINDSETERESESDVEVKLLNQKRPGGLRGITQPHTFSVVDLHFILSFCLLTRTGDNVSGTYFTNSERKQKPHMKTPISETVSRG